MSDKKAELYFHGKEGYNCAQAVLKAFQPESGMSEETIQSAKVAGGGRALGGTCGALYAAHIILGEGEHTHSITQNFAKQTGSTLCSDIKQSECGCRNFVGLAAKLTMQHLDKVDKNNIEYLNEREIRETAMLPQVGTKA